MTYKSSTKSLKSKPLFFVLVFGLTLLNSNIAIGRSVIGRKYPSSKTLRSIARIYMSYGDYAKAQPFAEQALTSAKERNASDIELSCCLIDLAYVYSNQGKFVEAENLYKLGLKLQEKVYYKKHPYIAYTLRNLGAMYREQGRFEDAKSVLDKAISIMLDSHQPQDELMAPFQVDVAKLLVAQGEFAEAEKRYLKALALIEKRYGSNHLYRAQVLGDIARLYTLQGRYSEAEQLVIQSLAVQERVYGPNHHLIAGTWLTMAEICKRKGDHIQLENLISRAVAAVEKTGNLVAVAKIQQRIAQIRGDRQVALAD